MHLLSTLCSSPTTQPVCNITIINIHCIHTHRRPMRKELSSLQFTDITTRWREDWESALVVNHFLVGDPTIRQPGFDLPRRQSCLLNRFRTAQGQCRACLKRWGQATSDLCDCGEIQTMSHIVEACSLTSSKEVYRRCMELTGLLPSGSLGDDPWHTKTTTTTVTTFSIDHNVKMTWEGSMEIISYPKHRRVTTLFF